MGIKLTIVDSDTKKPLAGTVTYNAGMQQVRTFTDIPATGGYLIDLGTSDINTITVSSPGYYDYVGRVDSLFDWTEIRLDKKPSVLPYVLIGSGLTLAVIYFWKRKNIF